MPLFTSIPVFHPVKEGINLDLFSLIDPDIQMYIANCYFPIKYYEVNTAYVFQHIVYWEREGGGGGGFRASLSNKLLPFFAK